MTETNLPAYIRALLQPGAYAHPVDEVRLVQTHISFVLLAGEYVYKFKKPVDFGFLDFSTLDRRHHCCEQEVRLNRRLCPDIYLGVVEVRCQDGEYGLDGEGEIVEYGVRMVRMPEERMMVRVIEAGLLGREQIDAIVDVLVPFYRQAAHSSEIDSFGTAEAVAVNVLENFEQTESFIRDSGPLSREQFDRISGYARGVLAHDELFEERIRAGRIRDCHGDLYSANICLADKVYIYDCIEFNDRFRYCDVASDVAFLAMDLDFHGLSDLGAHFIERFATRAGDDGLGAMLDFYKCYRAYVRGKIGLFTAADPAVDEPVRQANLDAAARYFHLADSYARRG